LFERYSKHVLKKYTADGLAKSSVLLDGFAGLSRHTAYVRYKTFGGSQMIRMGSSTIWINLKNGLRIGDIDGVDEENFPEIIGGLKSFARRLGIKEISFHCSAGTRLHAIFSRHYRAQPSFAALFQDFGSSIVPESVRFTFADLDIF
ncbi:MAG TPA: hypothetical protein VNR87_07755, partial [Flavisolibacter sp.]|nr:hypothetical protein [Flavisolibacter sp.]